jgi:hypothetical protein
MAKISANGAKEVACWYGRDKSGSYKKAVLRSDGVLLTKLIRGDGYTVKGRNVTVENAQRWAGKVGLTTRP